MEYWNHRYHAIPAKSGDNTNNCKSSAFRLNFSWGETSATAFDINREEDENVDPTIAMEGHHQNNEVRSVFKGLLNKASPEELSVLRSIFCTELQTPEWRTEFAAMIKEKQETCRYLSTRYRSHHSF